jgi:pimeloyl-ACP methyl ester carboxylesterase
MRTVKVEPPAEIGLLEGLSFALFLPAAEPPASVVVLHGASSCKESHFDFARACRADGLAAICFDVRGHGDSEGALDGRALDDVAAIAALARDRTGVDAVALRGSSMGGYLALVAAAGARAAAVVAICPASAAGLARGLRDERFEFRADAEGLGAVIAQHDELRAAEQLDVPLLLLHAEGDEVVPVEHSRALHVAAAGSRLVAIPGGHHRSVQHDPELQALSIRFIRDAARGTIR